MILHALEKPPGDGFSFVGMANGDRGLFIESGEGGPYSIEVDETTLERLADENYSLTVKRLSVDLFSIEIR